MKGFRVSIFKNAELGECSNGGVSATCDRVTIVDECLPAMHEPTDDAPAVFLQERCGDLIAVPFEPSKDGVGPMHGGSFVWSCDSRFRRVHPAPIRLHDRWESREDQRMSDPE